MTEDFCCDCCEKHFESTEVRVILPGVDEEETEIEWTVCRGCFLKNAGNPNTIEWNCAEHDGKFDGDRMNWGHGLMLQSMSILRGIGFKWKDVEGTFKLLLDKRKGSESV